MYAKPTRVRNLVRTAALVTCAAIVGSCGDLTAPIAVAAIDLSPGTATLASFGDTVRFVAQPKDLAGNLLTGFRVTWTSGDSALATVDSAGLVTSVGNGVVNISVTIEKITRSAVLTIKQVPVSIAMAPDTARISSLGDTSRFTAVARDARGFTIASPKLTWTTSDSSTVVVDSLGLATAAANGMVTVTASIDTVRGGAVAVVQQVVTSVLVSPATVRISSLTDTARISARARDGRGNPVTTPITWNSTDSTVVRIDSTGLATAVGNGSAILSAIADGVAGKASANVTLVAATVTVTPASANFASVGDTVRLTARAKDAKGNAIPAKFAWTTSDSTRVRIDSSGLATARANGTASILARADSASAAAAMTVKQVVKTVSVTPASATFASLGDTTRFVAVARDARGNAAPATFTWATSDASRIALDASGLGTAITIGTSAISATGEGLQAEVIATVDPVVASVAISPKGASTTSLAEGWSSSATLKDARGNIITGKTITWTSTAPSVFIVSPSGTSAPSFSYSSATGRGFAKLIAKSGAVADTQDVTVSQTQTGSYRVVPSSGTGWVGTYIDLTAGAIDSRGYAIASTTPTSWTTSNPSVATVDNNGRVTALAVGTVRITATSGTSSAFSDLTLTAIGGTVSLNSKLPRGTYPVASSIRIAAGSMLRLAPGVTLRFAPGTSLQADGILIAIGTTTDSVRFTSDRATPAPGDWGGILVSSIGNRLVYASDGEYFISTTFSYTDIGYALPVVIKDGSIENSHIHHLKRPQSFSCFIQECHYDYPSGAVSVKGGGTLIRGNTIEDNSLPGVSTIASPMIQRNLIQRNGDTTSTSALGEGGGILVEEGVALIEDNRIIANRAGYWGAGIAVRSTQAASPLSSAKATIRYNEIRDNVLLGSPNNGAAVMVRDSVQVDLTFNNIENNSCAPGPAFQGENAATECTAITFYQGGGRGSTVAYNNLKNAGPYEVYVRLTKGPLSIGSNYWNTTSLSQANARIKLGSGVTITAAPIVTARITTAGPRTP